MTRAAFSGIAQDRAGNGLNGAQITFRAGTDADSPLASVYAAASGGSPLTQPVATDADGRLRVFVAPGGNYRIEGFSEGGTGVDIWAAPAVVGRQYATRAEAVADVDYDPAPGTVITAGGLAYEVVEGAGAFADWPGRLPFGTLTINHFGAVGDWNGSTGTDNTASIQAAIDYVASLGVPQRNTIYVPKGRYMYVEITIPAGASNLSIKGDGWRASQLASTKATAGPIILVDTIGVQFLHIDLQGGGNDNSTQNVIVQLKRSTVTVADFDCEFIECRISGAFYGIESWGRGVTIRGGVMSLCRYGWNIEWPSDGEYVEGPEWHQKKATGMRRLIMDGVEIHALAVDGVRNRGANAANAKITILNVVSEIGDGVLQGYLGKGSMIANCKVFGATGPALTLDGGTDYLVSGCFMHGTTEAGETGAFTFMINLTGTHTNPTFRNLSIGYHREHGIRASAGSAVVGGVFEDIDFVEPCLSGSVFNPIIFIGAGHTAEVRKIRMRGATARDAIVRGTSVDSTINVLDAKHINGTTPAIKGSGVFSARSIHAVGLNDRRETMGSGSPEGVVVGLVGDVFVRADGGSGTTRYFKESGTGNTGWVAK